MNVAGAILISVAAFFPARLSAEGAAQEQLATVAETKAQADYYRGMEHQALKKGGVVQLDDRLRTDATGGVELRLKDGSLLWLGHKSEVNFLAETQAGSACLTQLAKGSLRANVKEQENGVFRISASYGVLALKGGRVEVLALAAGTEVRVLDGRAEFTGLQGEAPTKLGEGKKLVAEAGRVGKVKSMTASELSALRRAFAPKVSALKSHHSKSKPAKKPKKSVKNE